MAKKKLEELEEEKDYSIYDENIEDMEATSYIKDIVVKYGINVSVFRACAMIVDGLTPGQRRRLYTFYNMKAFPNKPRMKADHLLGPVSGLHPHGKQSIEKSFMNDIKQWESNVLLFDTNGNTGSVSGDSAAATRYLESRLSIYAMKCFFDDFDPEIADMVPSNTRIDMEPVFLPSRYPNFLFSTASGIAWGNAMSIPPFNVSEVCKLTIGLIKNPNMKKVRLYPDSPRGYDIIESDDIQAICDGGRGTLKTQARMEYYEDKKNGRYLEVRGFSEQTVMNNIMKAIAKMIIENKISGIASLANKAYLDDVKFWVILTKDADVERVKDTLYRETTLRYHLDINFNFAGKTSMQPVGLKEALLIWIDNAIDFKHRIYVKKLSKKKQRMHELEGILVMLDPKNIERTIDLVRNADTDEDSIQNLVNGYKKHNVTTYQASVISNLGLRRINRNNRMKYQEELNTIKSELDELYEIVSSRQKIKDLITNDLEECIKLFGKPRNCRVISKDALKPPVYRFNIVVTKKYIKKLSPNSTSVGIVDSDDDVILYCEDAIDTDKIFIITDMGKAYMIPLSKIRPHELANKGTKLSELITVTGTPIRAFRPSIHDSNAIENTSIIMFMQSGIVKRSPLSQYVSIRSELQGVALNDDDRVTYVTLYNTEDKLSDNHALIYTKNGLGIVLELDDITMTDRVTKGSQYLKVEDDDAVKGACSVHNTEGLILVITSKGYMKYCELDDIFKTNKRRTSMIRLAGLNNKDEIFKIIPYSGFNKITCVLQSGGRVDLASSDIPETTRVAKGKKMIPVRLGDSIVKVKLS